MRDGNCPFNSNYEQERFLVRAYRAMQGKNPPYGFWNTPNYVQRAFDLLTERENAEREEGNG